ncbi:GL20590 [Drosophila persimilis]|uniref:GL20590 n=1 Tax=Drosophila persimilis TaxID=7234 RepID=B4GY73_DROPE|nr:GL20590 [Drosophila persimilis]
MRKQLKKSPKKHKEKESSDSTGSSSQSQDSETATPTETQKKPAVGRTTCGAATSQARASSTGGSSKQKSKKKKFMPTEKKKPPSNPKLHVDRNFRLWLANRKIFIYRRKKCLQTRRTRVRNKAVKKRGEVVRTTLDLPTTDPGSDLHFSTDDEEHSPTSGPSGYGAVAPLRHTLLQSDLQRRYIEEIGDTVVQKPKPAHMPPELIVTTPSKSNSLVRQAARITQAITTQAPERERERIWPWNGTTTSAAALELRFRPGVPTVGTIFSRENRFPATASASANMQPISI